MIPPLLPDLHTDQLAPAPGLVHGDTATRIAAQLLPLPLDAFQASIDSSSAPVDLWIDLALILDERQRNDAVARLIERASAEIASERACKLACLRLMSNHRFLLANRLMAAMILRHGELPLLREWRQMTRRYAYRHATVDIGPGHPDAFVQERLIRCAEAIDDSVAPFVSLPVRTIDDLGTPIPTVSDQTARLTAGRPLHLTPGGALEPCPTLGADIDAGPFRLIEDAHIVGSAHPVLVYGSAIADDILCWMDPEEFNPFGTDSAYSGVVYRLTGRQTRQAVVRTRPAQREFARGILLNGPHQGNYFHWLSEHLIRVPFLDDLPAEFDDWPLLVCEEAFGHPNLVRALALAQGGRQRPLVKIAREETVRVGALLVPPRLSRIKACVQWQRHEEPRDCLLAAEGVRRLHDRLALSPKPGRKLYLERTGTTRLVNQDEIRAVLAKRGFESIDPSRLDFDTARRVYAEAAVVVSPAGAALTNLLLCPPGCVALNLTYELCRGCGVFSAIGTPLGQTVVNVCDHGVQPDTLAPFTLSPALVGQVLDSLGVQ